MDVNILYSMVLFRYIVIHEGICPQNINEDLAFTIYSHNI